MAILRFVAGLVLGWATWTLLLAGSFALLRVVWPDYGLAEPEKAYTLAMLLVRLVIFSLLVAATSVTATVISGDRRMPWIAGAVVLAMSIPQHLYPGYLWTDYPAWYHFAYLLLILPAAVYSGRWIRSVFTAPLIAEPAA